jgi:hypothetical protein
MLQRAEYVINTGKEKAEVVQKKKSKSESCLGFQVLTSTSITC